MRKSQEEIDVKKALLAFAVSLALVGTVQTGKAQDEDNSDGSWSTAHGKWPT
jgi:hypothetical protein